MMKDRTRTERARGVMTPRRLHVLGASGAGTSTLGAALAEALDAPHIDADDYYWQRTDPPFRRKREPSARFVTRSAVASTG